MDLDQEESGYERDGEGDGDQQGGKTQKKARGRGQEKARGKYEMTFQFSTLDEMSRFMQDYQQFRENVMRERAEAEAEAEEEAEARAKAEARDKVQDEDEENILTVIFQKKLNDALLKLRTFRQKIKEN